MKIRHILVIFIGVFATAFVAQAEDEVVPLQVGIVGDVMAQGLSQAITRQLEISKKVGIEFNNFAKGSSGFVRDDYYDWNAELPKILDGTELDYMLIFMGSNDRQSIRVKGKSYKPKTPVWREEYTHRIDKFLNQIQAKKVKVIWLGQPISRGKRFSNDMALFNEIYRQHVESHDGIYFDVWTLFANENGKYSSSGPDISGQIRKLRASNGIHFTRRGYDKLAFQILDLIENIESDDGDAGGNDDGVVVDFEKYDLSEQTNNETIVVLRKDDASAVEQVQQTVAKSIFQDNGADTPDDAIENSKLPQTKASVVTPLWKKVLKDGFIIKSEFGRSDDFSWPRN